MIIIRHKFISARQKESRVFGKPPKLAAVERSLAHVKYIQHRPGEDRDQGGRDLFNEDEENVDPKALRKAIKQLGNSKVVVHKLTLAPEIDPDDKKAFTREVMDNLSREKGLDLKWVAVEHNNTDHHHIHVVVLGEDKQGKEVRINKKDYSKMKEYGDRYLERVHPLEMERAREARDTKERARMEERKKVRESERQDRIQEGLELPWFHKKILREMYEPYEQWKKNPGKAAAAGREKSLVPDAEKPYFQDTIEASGKQWSKQNSLAELQELNQTLWDNQDERIPGDQYKKLVTWMKEKEELARSAPADKKEDRTDGTAPQKELDSISVAGRKWSKLDSLEDLKDVDTYLKDNPDKRLSKPEYKKLKEWMSEKETAQRTPEPEKEFETILVAGRKWSKLDSLQDLKEVEKFLKDNYEKRLDMDAFKKLKTWMREKELFGEPERKPWQEKQVKAEPKAAENVEPGTEQKEDPKKEPEKPTDYFEYKGEKYSKDTAYEKLTALSQSLRETKKEDRLPVMDYQNLRGWIENADRARYSGVLENQLELAKDQAWQSKARDGNPNNFRYIDPVQQELMANPVVGLYLQGASVAAQLVKWIPLDDRGRDFNKEAIEGLDAAKKEVHDAALKKGESGGEPQDKINKLDEAIDDKLDERKEEELKKKHAKKRDPFKFDPWGER